MLQKMPLSFTNYSTFLFFNMYVTMRTHWCTCKTNSLTQKALGDSTYETTQQAATATAVFAALKNVSISSLKVSLSCKHKNNISMKKIVIITIMIMMMIIKIIVVIVVLIIIMIIIIVQSDLLSTYEETQKV